MGLSIVTSRTFSKYKNLNEFIQALRGFIKSSIVKTGTQVMWDIFKNKKNYHENLADLYISITPRIILLGLVTANEYRSKNFNPDCLYKFCSDYLAIQDTINSDTKLEDEVLSVIDSFDKSQDKVKVPSKFIKFDLIKSCRVMLYLSRMIILQNETLHTRMEEFYTSYLLLSKLDNITNRKINFICKIIYDQDLLYLFRSSIGLFSIANNNNGSLDFKYLSCDKEITKRYSIDINTCYKVAKKASMSEETLKERWYKNGLTNSEYVYQKYYPLPLYNHPLVSLKSETNFILPSPAHFIRGITGSIYTKIFQHDATIPSKFGNVFEDHVGCVLNEIFGFGAVTEISGKYEKADFLITHPVCDIVFEIKTGIGAYSRLSLMNPNDVPFIWNRLYKACKQCSCSIKTSKNISKPIIAIIIISKHITAEASAFQYFALKSGLLDELEIDHLQFISWNDFESILAVSSVNIFLNAILNKQSKKEIVSYGDILGIDVKQDTPSHSYGYLKQAEVELFGENFCLNNDLSRK